MHITLTCVAFQDEPPPEDYSVQMDRQGGTIGRSKDNHFVILDPDQYASRHHARILIDDEAVFIEDTSNNGTLINEDIELYPGQRHELLDGDLLYIGEVTIEVSINAEEAAAAEEEPDVSSSIDDAFNFAFDDEPESEPEHEPEPAYDDAEEVEYEDEDYEEEAPEPVAESEPAPAAEEFEEEPYDEYEDEEEEYEQEEAYREEAPVEEADPEEDLADAAFSDLVDEADAEEAPAATPEVDDDDFDRAFGEQDDYADDEPEEEEAPRKAAREPAPAPAPEPVYAGDPLDAEALDVFLEELELSRDDLDMDIVQTMGVAAVVLRTLTQGIMEMLKARGSVKKNFGMDTTKIKGVRNNALKFSLSPEEALERMLKAQQGFLDPLDSVNEAVNDAKAHQVAMISGMNAAIKALLAKFDPEVLEESLEQGFSFSRKAKYWDLYKEQFAQIAKESEDHFNDLFAEEFTKTYEEQVRQLHADK